MLDASVAVKWYAPEEYTRESLAVLDAAERAQLGLIAPEILLSEFAHSLRKATRRGLDPREAAALLVTFRDVGIDLWPVADLADEALALAIEYGGSFYDALYIAVAIRDDTRVVTADDRMINVFARLGRCVHVAEFEP